MIRLAVSQRVDEVADRGETRDALDQALVAWIHRLGALPFPVPNTLGPAIGSWLEALRPEAVILSGGNDIGAFPERDETERGLIRHARERGLPLLGICRGMQLLASEAGARLEPVAGHVAVLHRLQGEISGPRASFHRQRPASVPDGWRMLATSDDGTVEAMAHETLGWEGWLFHPERQSPFREDDLARARRLLATNGRRS